MAKHVPITPSISPAFDSTLLRATEAGTTKFRERFERYFSSEFFRATTFGLTVSSIGIGTYLGESTDEDDALYDAGVQHAIRSGINLIDTAINYRSQRSEQAIGTAIQNVLASGDVTRAELVVSSKGGYIPLDRTPPATREEYRSYVQREFIDPQILRPDEIIGGGHSLAPRFLRYCLAKSRQNLGLRTIDIYYVHNPGQLLSSVGPADLNARLHSAFTVLEAAAARNEIGVYGCATWDELRVPPNAKDHISLENMVRIAREIAGHEHHFRAVQVPINLAMPEAFRVPTQQLGGKLLTLVQAASELELTVVASASLMQGALTANLPTELRDHFPSATTDAQRAVAFTRTVPGVTAALVGMKQRAHIDEIIQGARRAV